MNCIYYWKLIVTITVKNSHALGSGYAISV